MGAHTTPQGAITHKVVGAAVVLATEDRSERYLYRGTVFPASAFTEASVAHAVELGLVVATVPETVSTDPKTGEGEGDGGGDDNPAQGDSGKPNGKTAGARGKQD